MGSKDRCKQEKKEHLQFTKSGHYALNETSKTLALVHD